MTCSGDPDRSPDQRIDVSFHLPAATIEAHDCRVVLRRVEGPEASELFVACEPTTAVGAARQQAESVYRALLEALTTEGAGFDSVLDSDPAEPA